MGQCLLGRSPSLGTQSLMYMSGWNGQGVNKRSFSDSRTRDPEELLWYQNLLETLMSPQVRKYTNGVRGWRQKVCTKVGMFMLASYEGAVSVLPEHIMG